ncbi:hypothetical protein GCM10027592_29380 [Spirosoma flavus]
MKYKDITGNENVDESIKFLTQYGSDSKVNDYKNQYDITDEREIMDKTTRPDKVVVVDEKAGKNRIEKVNRLALPLQKRIVNSSVCFTFGNPVDLVCEVKEDSVESQILGAVNQILTDNKIDTVNRQIARNIARCTETAECWFPVSLAEDHDHYGFTTKLKIRVQEFSPWDGNKLYPFYDETGDMVAFSRAYRRKENGKDVDYFEVYTDEEKIGWKKVDQGWVQFVKEANILKKIPIVYGRQDKVEWHDVQSLIDRLEKTKSNFADTNDYFGSPILGVTGKITGLAAKGTQGKVIEMEKDAKAEYIEWENGPEAVKFEVEDLRRDIYGMTQTPDLSFDSVKGLDISGIAMKFLFMDAHLKVQDKREIFDAYLQRRLNIIKAFVGVLNLKWTKEAAKLVIKPKIVPYIITNEKDIIDLLSEATGGKPLVSQKTAVTLSGLVEDVDSEFAQIQEEETRSRSFDIREPTA